MFLHPRGWFAFPNTEASYPCIHDLGSRRVAVSLDPGFASEELICTWSGSTAIEFENRPPLAAELTGRFPRSSTTPVTYMLSHPDYLFGETTYDQTARFCPRLSEDDDGERCDKPVDSEYGDEPEGGCTCQDGVPCGNRWCDCGCPCCRGDVDYDEETPLWVCKEHNCHYSLCAQLHRASYTNALVLAEAENVLKLDAEFWGEQLFKRLWHTGCDVDFYNVDWRSDIGPDANYHQNVSNAFEVASRLWPELAAIPGEKVIMAHSLGNMVVSSMMQDYGLTNSIREYIVCNSAVPSEAYAEPDDLSMRIPELVHAQWVNYPTNSWASNWHKLFKNDVGDDRRFLGWPGRFIGVKPYISAVFYSTGDEVLEINDDNGGDIHFWTGMSDSLGHFSWHKQELFKGRGMIDGLGGTTWAGWSIDENILGVNRISVAEAIAMDLRDPSEFKTNTVFHLNPPSMNATNIPPLVRGAILASTLR